ncbi:cupin domain-containing protein [Kribbella sp. VKM Ac-2568]|uniref:cupin domain-containing protein n=1 Tax=Kribbella sp. VKM Ac-2568 TaxID=2512219 RepID=UPI0010E236AA|nr:cupin domain-containing protein [Kribbella sp. VKM Ac-2568]TCM42579.1 cupin domain [Kribbella sp. VKM Ac-2568]
MNQQATTGVRVVGPADGVVRSDPEGSRSDRFLIDREDSGGGFSLVEHTLAPHVLAAPLHLHTLEDEYSFILEGRLGALLGDEEVFAEAGTLVFKPRGQWHTFWNAGDVPVRLLEIISPGGLEQLFRKLGEPGGEYDPETLPALAAKYGCEVDFARTMPIVERHRLAF